MSPKSACKETIRSVAAVLFVAAAFVFAAWTAYGTLGENDIELVFRASEGHLQAARARRAALWRLSPLDVRADVEADDASIRVVADRRFQKTIERLLSWDGGIELYPIAAASKLDGAPSAGAVPVDRSFVLLPVAGTGLYESVAIDGSNRRVVPERPASVEISDDGKEVSVEVELDETRIAFADPDAFIVSIGNGALAVRGFRLTMDGNRTRLVLRAGSDIRAYRRAFQIARLLAAPSLPKLELATTRSMPSDVWLRLAMFVVPIAIGGTWFSIVRRFDRACPEPWWLVLSTGGIGMLLLLSVLVLRSPVHGSTLDPHLFDGLARVDLLPRAWLGFTLEAGLPEEAVKLFAILVLARWRREFDEPIDGIVYAAAAAIGFSCIEEYGYLAEGRLHAAAFAVRATRCPAIHVFLTSIIGYALGKNLGKGPRQFPVIMIALLVAASLHGLYDALASSPALANAAVILSGVLGSAFVVLVRRARSAVRCDVSPRRATRGSSS